MKGKYLHIAGRTKIIYKYIFLLGGGVWFLDQYMYGPLLVNMTGKKILVD
jgi:hypothetical protein